MESLGDGKDNFVINLVFCMSCATNFMDFLLTQKWGKRNTDVASRFWVPVPVLPMLIDGAAYT
jgi:hypothetical protein